MSPSYRARKPKPTPDPDAEHEYSSLQLNIGGRPADIMRKMQAGIAKVDLQPDKDREAEADDGLEHEYHVTARWGLHFQTPSVKLRQALKSFGPITIEFGKTSLFTGGDTDVLKIDIKSEDLHRLYKLIGRLVPTHTTFPTYRPHATLAYLKVGHGKKYVGEEGLNGVKMRFHALTFSGKRGHRETIPLDAVAPGPYRIR